MSLKNDINEFANNNLNIDKYFQTFIHKSVLGDKLLEARHRSLLSSHILGSLVAIIAFPIYLTFIGRPNEVETLAFIWLISPIFIAVYLSKTGNLVTTHIISSANLTALVTFVCYLTGGLSSFLLAWLVVVPIEASLSTSKKTTSLSLLLSIFGLSILYYTSTNDLMLSSGTFPVSDNYLYLIGYGSAILYISGISVSIQNIHEQTEQEIYLNQKLYKLTAENVSDLITRHDNSGKATYVSLAAKNILGYESSNLIGDGFIDFVHVSDRAAVLEAISTAITKKEEVNIEFRIKSIKDNYELTDENNILNVPQFIWAEMRCKQIDDFYEEGDSIVLAVTRDISDRKQFEQKIIRAAKESDKANASKTKFLANVSHELRTPLNAIIGFSEILSKEKYAKIADSQKCEYASLILQSGNHLLQVVNDLLDMARIEANKYDIYKEDIAPDILLNSCYKILKTTADNKHIILILDMEDHIPQMQADRRACRQIIMNLVSNAIKFSEPGDRVTMSASYNDDHIIYKVTDEGIGITEKDLQKLGEAFYQASNDYDKQYEGTGLGLSVVYGLVDLHKGKCDIKSKIGKGTEVTIALPVYQDPKPEDKDDSNENTEITVLRA